MSKSTLFLESIQTHQGSVSDKPMALYPIGSNLNELDELAVIYHDHLVLSTALIMRIDCCEEI